MSFSLTINEKEYFPEKEGQNLSLMNYLRNSLKLKSVKNGCGEGHCGACTVIIDGKAVMSCRKKLADLAGQRITTIDALSGEDWIHPLIYSYITAGAIQCGFCTPGFIMASKALLDTNPDPTEAEIRKALKANVCRCTGYVKIIEAVKEAAVLLRSGRKRMDTKELDLLKPAALGDSVFRPDALQKGTGVTAYADDLEIPGMLHARVKRAGVLSAEILNVDIREAEKVPGVVRVLTAADIPGENSFGPIKKDQQVLCDSMVHYEGDAVAAVLAETEEAAEAGAAAVRIEFREIPPVLTLDEALKPGARELHPGTGNIIARMESGRGDVTAGMEEADLIVEEILETQYVEHGYLEPESCVVRPDGEGGVIVHVASQGPPMDAEEIAPVLGVAPEKVRIAGTPMGGGFGGKEDISVQIIASLGAFLIGRPVKYTFSRRESIAVSGKRNSVVMDYRTGFRKDGRITALQLDLTARGGAYASVEEAVILRSSSFASGPYTIPAGEVKAKAVYLNHPPACAMRGFGNPTVTFGAETVMNMAADRLGIDPLELRLQNVLKPGLPTITGDRPVTSVGIEACLTAIRDALKEYEYPEPQPGWKIGTGIAASYKNVGLGIGMDDSAGADGRLLPDGSLELKVGCVDMGQGAVSAMTQLLSHELGWPFSRISVISADTVKTPLAGMTTASRQTFVSGNAVIKLAEKLKKEISESLIEAGGPETLLEAEGWILTEGVFRSRKTDQEILKFPAFLQKLAERKREIRETVRYQAPQTSFALKEPETGYENSTAGRLHAAYCFAAQATILEVNPEDGRVNVLDVIIASDAGRVINRAAVEGQMEGGVVMGLGYALSEEYIDGQTPVYGKLGIRRIDKTPRIKTIIVENPHDEGPLGAKGMGELPLSMGGPSVVHAVHDALGIWVTSLPLKPKKILAAQEASRV